MPPAAKSVATKSTAKSTPVKSATTKSTAATKPPTAQDILDELKPLGADYYRKILLNHGIKEPLYGVKIEHLKKIQKRIKTDHQLALDLFDTGVYDAMYLAGLIADEQRMTKKDLHHWIAHKNAAALCEHTIAGVAAGGPHGLDLALEWIDSKQEHVAAAGWATLSLIVATKDDAELDLAQIKQLLGRAAATIHDQPNHTRYAMNGFVIAVGCHVKPLTDQAAAAAKKIGKVTVDMGNTSCKVPDAVSYIDKVKQRGTLGRKRKSAKC